MNRALAVAVAAAALPACGRDLAPAEPATESADPDPLDLPAALDDGRLANLQRTIFSPICAAVPGQCHNGQFDPNLSTRAQTYYNLVNRGAIEHAHQYRVDAGDATGASHLVHKLRGSDGVLTIMPLGSAGLPKEQIAAVEAWIASGAMWDDAAAAPERPNNPPEPPLVQVWSGGVRLDEAGPFSVAPGTAIELRAFTRDLETLDAAVRVFFFSLRSADGGALVLTPDGNRPDLGLATFEPDGAPELAGEIYDRIFRWTVPAVVTALYDDGASAEIPAPGLVLTLVAAYLDGAFDDADAMLALTFLPNRITIVAPDDGGGGG